jgi:hypothetical protein
MSINWIRWRAFIKAARYTILFYVIGDLISTWLGLRVGAKEGNLLPAYCLEHFGIWSLVVLKFIIVIWAYKIYCGVYMSDDKFRQKSWNVVNGTITFLGVLATSTNLIGVVYLIYH